MRRIVTRTRGTRAGASVRPVPLALTGGQKLGLAIAAAIFIAFALASSFLFPRINPDFPGPRGVRPFVLASVLLMVGMLSAVWFLAHEDEEEGGHEEAASVVERA